MYTHIKQPLFRSKLPSQLLLEKGADVNYTYTCNNNSEYKYEPTIQSGQYEGEGRTPLYVACKIGHVNVVRLLLKWFIPFSALK